MHYAIQPAVKFITPETEGCYIMRLLPKKHLVPLGSNNLGHFHMTYLLSIHPDLLSNYTMPTVY